MNKMIIHYCGGAGINVSRVINEELSELGEGYCSIHPRYIDTSENNMGGLDLDLLWRVATPEFGGEDIDGSGSERRSNSVAITESVKDYLDESNHHNPVTGEYHVVVFSGSGGKLTIH